MRLLTNLLFKVTLSSMILTAPAMINGNTKYDGGDSFLNDKKKPLSFFTATVIKRYVDHPTVVAMRAFPKEKAFVASPMALSVGKVTAAIANTTAIAPMPESFTGLKAESTSSLVATKVEAIRATEVARTTEVAKTTTISAELRRVINQAAMIYTAMNLQETGLDQKAFEYAWRGYHNLLKKGAIHKRSVLSICDFSQSSRSKRMYVIDVQHKKLLYRTYVAHGQNSGDEFASTFSNDEDSYKSSLGFYITERTYVGRNGLSLRLDGVDPGYNDKALKRNIVLHGASYVGEPYMQEYGNLGTSLGCPALPIEMSARIIHAVKGGSCLFIYHPTAQYLDNSSIIHG
ncbi:murein L,D-transpeptidase catalytic domain family protein [Puia dinghuensis]|uniref:Murein L,D-transpeptidase catalytic domain family protein n=1 Tax=Puia dinghuensis TaxID=1792502 RepID=A0A8J2U8V4_9BACT|nr:murein L,D-transpeptidase catalytic domain family protein [Puia dinghuensis]GGA86801.1 hypothetical protein GCM10011511_07340 [Puia dinghuensis]